MKAGSWRRPSDPTCAPHVHLRPDSGRRPNRRRRLGRRTSAAARSTQTPVEPCRPRSPSTISRTAHPNRAACPATPGGQGPVCELESRGRYCELLHPPPPVAQTFSTSTRVSQVFCLSRPPVRYSIAHSRLRRPTTSRRPSDVEGGQRTEASGTQRRGRNKCSTKTCAINWAPGPASLSRGPAAPPVLLGSRKVSVKLPL